VTHLFELGPSDVAATNDEWYTPRWIFKAAGLVFDLDVCAPVAPEFRTCPARRYLTILDDGLTAPWDGLVWMNPPYSNPAPWADRFIAHPDGLALVPASNSHWRGRYAKAADGIALICVNGSARNHNLGPAWNHVGFGRPDGGQVSYPTALILAARGSLALSALERVATADPYAGGAWFIRPAK
jgi:DNA N-6-adenine-methyltransferase (Dam)